VLDLGEKRTRSSPETLGTMPNTPIVTGLVVDPASMPPGNGEHSERRAETLAVPMPPGTAKDSIITVKSPETVEAERQARLEQVKASELKTASQRQVNLIWEYTQAGIATVVVLACIAATFVLDPDKGEMLRNAFFLIVGFYFGRTNHQKEGGSGSHEPLQQGGR
jgi:hypothetical protein